MADGLEILERRRHDLRNHLISNIGVDLNDAEDAINAMVDLLNQFVEDHSSLMHGRSSFSRHLGRPPRPIERTTAGQAFIQSVDNVMTVLRDVCHHTTRLKDIDSPLARDMPILNNSETNIRG